MPMSCPDCGTSLDDTSVGQPCPSCGSSRRDATAQPGVIKAKVRIHPITFLLGHEAWVTWTEIAVAHEDFSWRARKSLEATGDAAEMEKEFRPALIAITAAAFALDALYQAAKKLKDFPLPPKGRRRGRRRWGRIFETLKRGVAHGGTTAPWPPEFKWLFNRRDESVHFVAEARAPVPHPSPALATHVAHEMGTWSAESATRAVNLLLDVLEAWAQDPTGPNEKWAADWAGRVQRLVDSRETLRAAHGS
jgi:hypothetical protein